MEYENQIISLLNDLIDFEENHNIKKRFNIFEAIGMRHQEIRHSRFLASLLDPIELHGLGDKFLRLFLIKSMEKAKEKSVHLPINRIHAAIGDLSNSEIHIERDYFDISIHIPNLNLLLLIENKLFAQERSGQLEEYKKTAREKYKNPDILGCFLTREGYEGEDSSWVTLSYSDILDIIQSIYLSNNTIPNDVALAINHYIELLKRHIVISEELKAACKQIYRTHREALEMIVEHGKSPILHEAFELFAKNKSLISCRNTGKNRENFIHVDWHNNPQFQVANESKWPSSFPLIFWFYLQDDSILLFLEVGPIQAENFDRDAFLAHLSKLGFKSKRKNISNTYTRIGKWKENISDNMDPEEIREKISKLWIDFGGDEKLKSLTDFINNTPQFFIK